MNVFRSAFAEILASNARVSCSLVIRPSLISCAASETVSWVRSCSCSAARALPSTHSMTAHAAPTALNVRIAPPRVDGTRKQGYELRRRKAMLGAAEEYGDAAFAPVIAG